jgi:hypothetical protein
MPSLEFSRAWLAFAALVFFPNSLIVAPLDRISYLAFNRLRQKPRTRWRLRDRYCCLILGNVRVTQRRWARAGTR